MNKTEKEILSNLLKRVELLEDEVKRMRDIESELTYNPLLQVEQVECDTEEIREKRLIQYAVEVGKRDRTKYRFNGEILNKRDLVYKCVKYYCAMHKNISEEEFKNAFPYEMEDESGNMIKTQGSFGIVKPDADIKQKVDIDPKKSNGEKPKGKPYDERFFEDAISIEGKKYRICSEWNKENIKNFLINAKRLGLLITEVEQ